MMNGDNKDKYDQMSTDELHKLLVKDILDGGDGLDGDTILYINEVIEKREGKSVDAAKVDAAWLDLKKNYMMQPTRNMRRRLLECISVALMLIGIGGSFMAKASDLNLFRFVAQWTRDTFQLGSDVEEPTDENADEWEKGSNLQNYLREEAGLDEPLAPTWLPSGFILANIKVSELSNCTAYVALYQQENRVIIVTIRHLQDADTRENEKDAAMAKIYTSGGVDHFIMNNEGQVRATWASGQNECSINGDISETNIKKMIDSIYQKE